MENSSLQIAENINTRNMTQRAATAMSKTLRSIATGLAQLLQISAL